MSEVTKHAPGLFCWADLSTTDQDGAKKFYTGLFDWTIDDIPMGPDNVYTKLQIRQKDVVALHKQEADQAAQGVPSHWLSYVSVADVDATGRKAVELGGKLVAGPFDVFEYGRMAVIQDPTGAMIAVWQAKAHIGSQIANETGAMCWHELYTRDTAAATAFYTGLFGWGAKASTDGMPYTEWQNEGKSIGGMMAISKEMGDVPPNWLVYFMVDDCDAITERTKKLGGKAMMGPMDIPNVGRFAVLSDPQGAAFAIVRLTHPM